MTFPSEKPEVDRLLTVVYRWERRDPRRRSGWRRLGWAMTEEDASEWAKANETEVRKISGSREERQDVDGRYPGARK